MRWRCLLRPIRPVHSCMIIEDCLRESGWTNVSHFLDGADLSMVRRWLYRGDSFQRRTQQRWSVVFEPCRNADVLAGRGFFNTSGSLLDGLDLPVAAAFASSSASSLGAKSLCPGTQWICKLQIPLFFKGRWHPCIRARVMSAELHSLSYCCCSFSVASCM